MLPSPSKYGAPGALGPAVTALGVVLFAAPASHADAPPAGLMAKLAASASSLSDLGKTATFAMDTRIETLDGDGHVTGVETKSGHLVREGAETHMVVLRATKDGQDCTEKARESARAEETANGGDMKGRFDIPFLASQQPRYVFDLVETDASRPSRVRIAFTPKHPDAHSVEGSAWVDR
ncbi:MAG: hypothetical protein JOZ69_03255, partial [Myxococcales bacterium]|nr:hypothetical protein [Myxococcales bacterium]